MEEYLSHFSEGLSLDIQEYATNDVFRHSRYIFTNRKSKQQYGFCSHCSSSFKTKGLTHNSTDECPECGSACTVKASGRGRKGLIDEAYFIYYEKSAKDPKVIVARGIYALRDYSDDYHFIKTKYLERTRYIFGMGNSSMFERYGYYSQARTIQHGEFSQRKTIYSMFSQFDSNHRRNMTIKYSRESIKKAIKDTPFSWSGWESYDSDGVVKFFDLYSRYPCVEYLTKFGFEALVEAKLNGGNTYSSINWRGKTLFNVLRLNKKELNEIKGAKAPVDPLFLRLLQISKKDKSDLSFAELTKIKDKYGYYIKDLQRVLKFTTLRKANAYINKQFKDKNKFIDESNFETRHYYSEHQVLTTWGDYISDCLKLEFDLTDDQTLFPGNLHNAHQNTIKQVEVEGDKLLDKKLKVRAESLNNYCFEYAGLRIRPALNTKELIAEGKALKHCVGTYAARYAKGEMILLFIRKTSDLDKPFFTMEVRKDQIIQTRGKSNCIPTKVVSEFVKVFTEQKLTTKKEKSVARIAIPA